MVKRKTQFDVQRILVWILFLWHLVFSQDQFLFESFDSTENRALKGFVFEVFNNVHSYFECYRKCEEHRHKACSSVNFYPSKKVCELNYASHVSHPNKMEDEEGATYLFNLAQKEDITRSGKWIGLGGLADLPAKTCKNIKDVYPWLRSGNYWLDVDITCPKKPFLSYCDMETDGGGWTLVWSFTFNNYQQFKNFANYVKPVPTNIYTSDVKNSSTPPKNETDMNAIDFNIWKDIGSEFLVKSNINNWVACVPNSGNLVTKTAGNVHCRFIKQIVTEQPDCKEVPGEIKLTRYGFINLKGKTTQKSMYLFNAHNGSNWPTHDPCAMTKENHKKNVNNPHTNIYIR